MPPCPTPLRRERWVWYAVLVALTVRLLVFFTSRDALITSIEESYIASTATLVSGYGYQMRTTKALENKHGFPTITTSIDCMRQREAEGGRVDREHPYPKSPIGWIPAVVHPAGYSWLLYPLYRLGNFSGMISSARVLQIVTDSLVCVLAFLFARNIFGAPVGRLAAWLYAFCPAMIYLCQTILPDAYHGFFAGSILCLASFATPRRGAWLLAAGAATGLACHFRSEYQLMPLVIFLIVLLNWRRFVPSVAWSAGMTAVMLIVLAPWALWTKQVSGHAQFGGVGAWSGMYVGIGEDPQNPWGIVMNEPWLTQDAINRGFESHISHEANQEYKKLCWQYVRQYPGRYARCILVNRLPLAFATPHLTTNRTTSGEFSFTKYLVEEGLTRWGVIRKYPGKVVKYMGPQLAMSAVSALLTLSLLVTLVVFRREWRRVAWLVIPWGYTVGTVVLIKSIEPRNMAPPLFVQTVALAIVVTYVVHRWRGRPFVFPSIRDDEPMTARRA